MFVVLARPRDLPRHRVSSWRAGTSTSRYSSCPAARCRRSPVRQPSTSCTGSGASCGTPRSGWSRPSTWPCRLLHVRDSHFGTTDVTMTALITLAVLFIVKWQQAPGHRLAALSGIAGGAAASTKYNGLGVGLPFVIAAGLHLWTGPVLGRVRPKTIAIAAAIAAAAGLVTFLVLSPYVIIDWPRFVRDVTTRGDSLVKPHGVDVGPGWRHHALCHAARRIRLAAVPVERGRSDRAAGRPVQAIDRPAVVPDRVLRRDRQPGHRVRALRLAPGARSWRSPRDG